MRTCLLAAVLAMIAMPVSAEFEPWVPDFSTYTLGDVNGQDGWTDSSKSVQVVDTDHGRALLLSGDASPTLRNANFLSPVNPATNLPYSQCIAFDIWFSDTAASLTQHENMDFQVNIIQWLLGKNWNYLVAFGYVRGHVTTDNSLQYRPTDAATQSFAPFEAQTWYRVEMVFDMEAHEGWITVQPEGGALWESDKTPLNYGWEWSPDFFFLANNVKAWDGTVVPVSYYLANVSVTPLVPEPATMSLLGLGALALLRRRR